MARDEAHCLFISDLHLCESRPLITQAFISFLESTASHAQALYILGDFFEYWAGDDAIAAGQHQEIIAALKALSAQTSVYFMHGNRDFLIGETFAKATGTTILSDPTCINLFGKPTLLCHGDTLCTDDSAYQKFRSEVRSSEWQSVFLSQSLEKRLAIIEGLRADSEQAKSSKSMQIMDVNQGAVEALFRQFDYSPLLIHGHTHRPNTHIHKLDAHTCERWVLGDWYEQGSYLRVDAQGCHSQVI